MTQRSEAAQQHEVQAPVLRAHIAQAEFARRYPRGEFLPYVHEAIDTLPQRITAYIERGRPVEAEYWLLMAEKFAGCIDAATLQRRVTALGPLEPTEGAS